MDISLINQLSAEKWAEILKGGFAQFEDQMRNAQPLTYTEFGPVGAIMAEEARLDPRTLVNPTNVLLRLYRTLSDEGKLAYRQGLIQIIEKLSPPPTENNALLINPITELVYRGDHLMDVVTAFTKRVESNPAWRNDSVNYNAIFQIAYSYHRHAEGALLGQAIMGPESDHSPYFRPSSFMHQAVINAIDEIGLPHATDKGSGRRT